MSNSRASSLIENSLRSVSSIHMVGCTGFYMGSSGMGEAEELSKVYHDVAERSSKLLGEFAQKQAQGMSSAVRDEMGIARRSWTCTPAWRPTRACSRHSR